MQAVRRIQATPGFVDSSQQAAAAYQKQRQAASQASALVRSRYKAAEGESLTWLKRPHVQQVKCCPIRQGSSISRMQGCVSGILVSSSCADPSLSAHTSRVHLSGYVQFHEVAQELPSGYLASARKAVRSVIVKIIAKFACIGADSLWLAYGNA